MKRNPVILGVMALALSALTASACYPTVSGVVSCPNGQSAEGIVVWVSHIGTTTTTANGAFFFDLVPGWEYTYEICIVESSLPPGVSVVGNNCVKFSVSEKDWYADVNFTLKGDFCETPPTPGPCWLTGGGTIEKSKGVPHYSFGGVVNPGCSPTAAGGGNWNVVNHLDKLHFKGLDIVVTNCSGVPTKSPRVDVNVIDFEGIGTLAGINGNPMPLTAVAFVAQAVDASEPGAGKDQLYLNVKDLATGEILLLISADPANPAVKAPVAITTGNLQMHTSSCQ